MKVLFLDIDGVLNSAGSRSRSPDGYIGVDDKKVTRLRHIVEATGAIIVLVSTWQKEFQADSETPSGKYLRNKLKKAHLQISDMTRDSGRERGKAILEWVTAHPDVDRWIILDDTIYPNYKASGITSHMVQPSFYEGGLTDEIAEKAIQMLNDNDRSYFV